MKLFSTKRLCTALSTRQRTVFFIKIYAYVKNLFHDGLVNIVPQKSPVIKPFFRRVHH